LHRVVRLTNGIAETEQRTVHALAPASTAAARQDDDVLCERRAGELVFQFEDDALRGLAADTGYQREGREVVGRNRPAQCSRRVDGQHRLSQPWPDACRGL